MSRVKKFLLITLALSLVFAIASCGGGSDSDNGENKPCEICTDGNGDGICDVCNKKTEQNELSSVPLFVDGKPSFHIVLSKSASDEVKAGVVTSIQEMLKTTYNADVEVVTEESENDKITDVEILIGEVSSRGDAYLSKSLELGKKGFEISIVGSKIIINAGSDATLLEAINIFVEKVLTVSDITNLKMTEEQVMVSLPKYYVTSIKINGNDIRDYTIAANLTEKYHKAAALALQDSIYQDIGYWIPVVDIENATDKSMILRHVDGVPTEESFKVTVDGNKLLLECSYDNMFEIATVQFTTQTISVKNGEVNLESGTVFNQDVSVVYYEDFGAKGDGQTDDFFALYNTHVFANECGQTVKPSRKENAKLTYYIYDTRPNPELSNETVAIPIKTTTDWQGVTFIIDDKKIPTFTVADDPDHMMHYQLGKGSIFEILPDDEHKGFKFDDKEVLSAIAATGLNPKTTHIDFKLDGWDGGLMLVPYSSHHKVFRRKGAYGSLQSAGADMHELIIIDKDGNVSKETPIMFEYTNIDYMLVYKLDPSTAISVGNAKIETIGARVENVQFINGVKDVISTAYIARGIYVTRSYTTVHDIEHVVHEGYTLKERANGLESSNYQGMFRAANADHVTFKDCIMPGRQQYGGHSSYNFNATCVNKIVLEHCIQPNFWITVDENNGTMTGHTEYQPYAYPSMSTVQIYSDRFEKLIDVPMCWGLGGTNYCKNMEYIDSQISRFDAHQGLYNGKIINSKVNALALTGYGELIVENVDWYQYQTSLAFFALRSDYGYMWNGSLTAKNVRAHLYDITDAVPDLTIVGHAYSNFYFGYPTSFPSITLENFDVYSTKNQAPVAAGYEINLYRFRETAKQMHLSGDAGSPAIFTYLDEDHDGYIDEPIFDIDFDGDIDEDDRVDFDGDGNVGNTSMLYSEHAGKDMKELNKGIIHNDCTRNLNPVKPPEFIKITKNDGVNKSGGYIYKVVNTAQSALIDGVGISDGGWYRAEGEEDTYGGFFGKTKFIYEVTVNNRSEEFTLIGSDHENNETFAFILSYY